MPGLAVFSDVSQMQHVRGEQFNGPFAGCYIVGMGGKPIMFELDCRSSVDAELTASLMALKAAMCIRHPTQEIIVHTDLADIKAILRKRVRGPAAMLTRMLRIAEAKIVPDARQFREYQTCHHYARVQVGIYGLNHPERVAV